MTGNSFMGFPRGFSRKPVFIEALKYSIPVLLGYVTLGFAFGLVAVGTGYPWWLSLFMSVWIFAGAGQFFAIGLFAAGTTIWEVCLIQLVLNIRHAAYSFSMLNKFSGPFKPYLIFSLSDETFALFSALPVLPEDKRHLFMVYVAVLDQIYWVSGTLLGALAGAFIPFDMKGVSFALTALFVVLMMEQIKRIKRPGVFIVSAAAALLGVSFLPGTISLLAALAPALLLSAIVERNWLKVSENHE
jgi:4-azaleucine resistance transporter AzlC